MDDKKGFKEEVDGKKYEEASVGVPISLSDNDETEGVIDIHTEEVSSDDDTSPQDGFVKKEELFTEEEVDNETKRASWKSNPRVLKYVKYGMFFVAVAIIIIVVAFVYDIYRGLTTKPASLEQVNASRVVEIPSLSKDKRKSTPPISLADKYGVSKSKALSAVADEKVKPREKKKADNIYGVPEIEEGFSLSKNAIIDKDIRPANSPTEEHTFASKDRRTNTIPLSGVETELMGISEKNHGDIQNGGTCELSVKFKANDEYIYYIAVENGFIPIFKDKNWDGKGIVVPAKIVAESYAPVDNFIEIEKGKFLPSEMFSKCTPISI